MGTSLNWFVGTKLLNVFTVLFRITSFLAFGGTEPSLRYGPSEAGTAWTARLPHGVPIENASRLGYSAQ